MKKEKVNPEKIIVRLKQILYRLEKLKQEKENVGQEWTDTHILKN
jgi:uncharacterized protein (UPF0335 family)